MLIGINDHLLQTWNIPKQSINTKELAYENYVKWEESGGKELQLPGFFLTNRQMYWVALANKMYTKIHPHNKKYEKTFFECQLKHFHLVFKNQKSFREAYNCPNMTDIENDVFKRCL